MGRKLRIHEQKHSRARRKRLRCRLYLVDKLNRRVACISEDRAVKDEELSPVSLAGTICKHSVTF